MAEINEELNCLAVCINRGITVIREAESNRVGVCVSLELSIK